MKPLIICYSHSGNNERLASSIKNSLGCDILTINEKKKRKTISILIDYIFSRSSKLSYYQIDKYKSEIFILITPVWGGRIASPMRAFVEREKNNIKKYLVITLCNGLPGQKEKINEEMSSIIQREPISVIELWINRLLPEEKRNKVKHTFNYKVSENDLKQFEEEIKEFIGIINNTCV
ncbi:hypothetical protein GC105_00840 [Alkalibaculum sp. M08DMB]|uniref:Flavodoxin n=1 Tax=Alkalibaculum sporogenes TaxID=2655001 RepID=A0A6A7K4M1_9FIRM|nr:flavodoxin family protein [Alkalibaculum sporogenes]MPW24338.1 hypothetical protein [Alkalibaculum sporogenes]